MFLTAKLYLSWAPRATVPKSWRVLLNIFSAHSWAARSEGKKTTRSAVSKVLRATLIYAVKGMPSVKVSLLVGTRVMPYNPTTLTRGLPRCPPAPPLLLPIFIEYL